jgi:hypothetical protein
LIHRLAVSKFLENLNVCLNKHGIRHSTLSQEAGRTVGSFNKTYNRVEDLSLSSFLRYWRSLQRLLEGVPTADMPHFEKLFDYEIQKMMDAAIELSTFEVEDVVTRERTLFKGMVALVERLKRNRVIKEQDPEWLAFELVKELFIL